MGNVGGQSHDYRCCIGRSRMSPLAWTKKMGIVYIIMFLLDFPRARLALILIPSDCFLLFETTVDAVILMLIIDVHAYGNR